MGPSPPFSVLALLIVFTLATFARAAPCPTQLGGAICSGHGLCDEPNRQCKCFEGYQGADCSEMICPFGHAWADAPYATDQAHALVECSNMGVCDRTTGLCTCKDMFEGAACERMTCPATCNNRGQCLTMSDYARTVDLGTIDSSIGRPYTYDSVWDATKIRGCSCNDGYFGPQCSSRECPRGDDPLTGGLFVTAARPRQFNERQTITCQATEGTFTLSFKGYTTDRIPFAASDVQLKAYLEALPSIGLELSLTIITSRT